MDAELAAIRTLRTLGVRLSPLTISLEPGSDEWTYTVNVRTGETHRC